MVVETCFSLKTYLFSIIDHQSRGWLRIMLLVIQSRFDDVGVVIYFWVPIQKEKIQKYQKILFGRKQKICVVMRRGC